MNGLDSSNVIFWLPQAVISFLAACSWIVTAVVVSRSRTTPLQIAAFLLGCAHALGAGRALLVGAGATPGDGYTAIVQFTTALTCLCVSVCVLTSSLAEKWKPQECSFSPRRDGSDVHPVLSRRA